MKEEVKTKSDILVNEIAKEIVKTSLDEGVPVQWLFNRIQQSVFAKTERLHTDIDWLLPKGNTAKEWYEKQIKECERRKGIFGKDQS